MEKVTIEKCYTNSMKRGESLLHAVEQGGVRYEVAEAGGTLVLRKIYLGDEENPNTGFFIAAVDLTALVDAVEEGNEVKFFEIPFRS